MDKIKKQKYGAAEIKVLEGLEGIRKRPSMYIGSTGKDGLHHLIYEVVDNAVDEALVGYCNKINVFLNKDGSATIEDDGRGIPVEPHPTYKLPAVELALTKLHAGGKFDKKSYMISGGLHGVGISVVNALSKRMVVEIKRNGKIYQQEYSRGKTKTKLKVARTAKSAGTGTKITFWPDEQIFSALKWDYKILETRFREIVFLNAGLKIILKDETTGKKQEFFAAGGLIEFVKWLNKTRETLHKPIYFKRQVKDTVIEVSIQYNRSYRENIFGFVNTINTVEGGTHISGFKTALTRAINDYARKKNMLKNGSLSGDDVREGIMAVVSTKISHPQFEGQTKTKLGNSEIKGFVDSVVTSALSEFFEENPTIARRITNKALESAKARLAAKKAKDLVRRKNAFSLGGLPGKLADCSSKKPENTELYIVEGASAAGSSKMARDKEIQAVLPLKGKILNVEKANPVRALSNEEITNLITAIGTGVGEQFNLDKLRYNKIVIMCDADSVDYDTPLLVFNKEKGEVHYKKVGNFVEDSKNHSFFQLMTFNNNQLKLENIHKLIKHPKRTKMFEIRTYCGYSIKTTSCHSVFVYDDGKIIAKEGNKIKPGDFLITPKSFPHPIKQYNIDIKDLLREYENIQVKVDKNKIKKIPESAWIDISRDEWKNIKGVRVKKKISRYKIAKVCGIYKTIIQQWEEKIDNVMPRYKDLKKYLGFLNINIKNINYSLFIPIKNYKSSLKSIEGCFLRYHRGKIKTLFKVNEDFAYLLGWYLGDGCQAFTKNNPNRFTISVGYDKEYIPRISKTIKNVLGVAPILDKINLHFHSLPFKLILENLGLLNKKSKDKFIPDLFFNTNKKIQFALLEGLLHSDGHITVSKAKSGKIKALIGHTTISEDLANGILFIYRQNSIFPSISIRMPKKRARYKRHDVNVSTFDQLKKCYDVWKDHKFYKKLEVYLDNINKTKLIGKQLKPISEDFVAIKVKKIAKAKTKSNYVYDFSVPPTQNFIAGNGGFMLHNTDGEHIKTLLLTFFFRFMPDLIKNGNIYAAMPPLYRVRKRKDYYVYSDKELKKITKKLGTTNVTRFKGLGEMNPIQLWETTMNPKTRKIQKIFIEDAVEADKTFSMLMGDDVQARKEFISENAREANLDI